MLLVLISLLTITYQPAFLLPIYFMYVLLTVSMGVVRRPHAKNSRNMTTTAWVTLARPVVLVLQDRKEHIPPLCGDDLSETFHRPHNE